MAIQGISSKISRGSGDLAILALLGEGPLYGFEIAKSLLPTFATLLLAQDLESGPGAVIV